MATGLVLLAACRREALLAHLHLPQMEPTTVRLEHFRPLGEVEQCQFQIREHALELIKEAQACLEGTFLVAT